MASARWGVRQPATERAQKMLLVLLALILRRTRRSASRSMGAALARHFNLSEELIAGWGRDCATHAVRRWPARDGATYRALRRALALISQGKISDALRFARLSWHRRHHPP